jgi:choline-sulfatase
MRGLLSRRLAIALALLAAIAAIALVVVLTHKNAPPRYVFLICLDACRRDHLGCYGYRVDTSPRLDELARRGALFEDAVTQAPWTVPSVATIMSSTFPCQHGARRTEGTRVESSALPGNFIETLADLGFETALFTGGIAIKDKVPTSDLLGSTLQWLKKNIDSRCVVVIHSYETHYPYVGTGSCVNRLDPGYEGPFKFRFESMEILKKTRIGRFDQTGLTDGDIRHIKALYDCQIMSADKAVGAFVDTLEAWDVLDKSIIIVFADHGEEFLEHGSIEHGQQLYEETLHVPLVLVAPSVVSGPKRVAEQVGLIDLAPTVLDLLGLEKPAYFEGRSLAPLISDRYRAAPQANRPCGIPTDCLVAESIAHRPEMKVLRCPPWKLFFDPFFGATELYDLASDPGEKHNLIDERPEVASRMSDELLILEKYYPGGWFIAWRGDGHQRVRGRVTLQSGLIEAVAHNFFPEMDAATDSLQISQDWSRVRFATRSGPKWRGVELRMAGPWDAEINADLLSAAGRAIGKPSVGIGPQLTSAGLPLTVTPGQARVERRDLRGLFARAEETGVRWLVFWVEPGSEPTAKAKKQAELRQHLKAVGYIE